MSARKVLLTDPKPGKTIVVRSEDVDRLTPEAENALRAIREKIDSIGSKIDQGATIVGRLEAKLGQS